MRKNKNRSGSVSVQVVSKGRGVFRVVRTLGSATDPNEIERLVNAARDFIVNPTRTTPLFSTRSPADHAVLNFVSGLSNDAVRTIGPELIFGTIFDQIGFGTIPDERFRHLVIARLAFPTSKRKTVDYLWRFRRIRTHEDALYRFLDRVAGTHKPVAERVAYEHSKKTLGTITVVFYDITTLYFEAEDEDDLRKKGWSKDGKPECPQIMVGLLVGHDGFPVGYDIFEGNTWEGGTLVPMLETISEKYRIGKPVVVADAAMLSKKNLYDLAVAGYTFIVGGRIKNENEKTKKIILEKVRTLTEGQAITVKREDGTRLVISFSEKRRKKDARNRERGLEKLRVRIRTGKLAKEHIHNRGYNKFLTMSGEMSVAVDEERVRDDAHWDGLKGYVTNSALPAAKVIERYGDLWQIEYAFRISKTDLRIRPVYHYRRRRIEAHLCIVFVAYVIWKELERRLQKAGVAMSARRAGELTQNMYELVYELPHIKQTQRRLLSMDDEQRELYEVIHKR